MKVFITQEIPEIASKLLKAKNFEVSVYPKNKPISKNELLKSIKNVDAVISLLTDKFDSVILDKMSNCKVIANYAVGFNNIDIKYAKQKGITVTNTPDVLTDATADLAIALTLACARRFVEGIELVRLKKFKGWFPKLLLGVELKNKVFGIIGAGRIGTATAIRAKSFGTRIIYFSKSRNVFLENEIAAKKVSLAFLLKHSDIISVHLPLNPKTFHLLDKNKLLLLKEMAIFINTARGDIVDEKALINILKREKIFAAGFDVYENEPVLNPDLYKLKNVVLLPHIGSASIDARNNMAILAAKNVIAVLSGKKPLTPVN
ncbi:MAG: 2-hydroxyacid dehydrogenase [Ignavibacteriaceae bacterium]